MDYHRNEKDPLSSAIDTAGSSSALLRAGAPAMLCMLSSMAGHSRSGPLLPHRNWGPGEIVGGVERTRYYGSCCSTVTDVYCVLITCFVEGGEREYGGNTSLSPSWGDQPSSYREILLLGRFPSFVHGVYWHVERLRVFEAFLF